MRLVDIDTSIAEIDKRLIDLSLADAADDEEEKEDAAYAANVFKREPWYTSGRMRLATMVLSVLALSSAAQHRLHVYKRSTTLEESTRDEAAVKEQLALVQKWRAWETQQLADLASSGSGAASPAPSRWRSAPPPAPAVVARTEMQRLLAS
jgi:hypothetical protein